MNLGETLDVYRRTDKGELGRLMGTALLVQPDIAQAIPPLDTALSTSSDGVPTLLVRRHADDRSEPVEVRRAYPGLVSPAEADRIAAEECPALRLVDDADVLVFLGLATALADPDPNEICKQATICQIVCLWYCKRC